MASGLICHRLKGRIFPLARLQWARPLTFLELATYASRLGAMTTEANLTENLSKVTERVLLTGMPKATPQLLASQAMVDLHARAHRVQL